jgi:hypothetical protein
MSSYECPSENGVFCGKHFQKGERVHSTDMSKEWFRLIFEQKLLTHFIDQSCYMRIYHVYQTSLVNQKLITVSEKVHNGVQTDPVKICDLSAMVNTTTVTSSDSNIGSPAKRRALHSITSDDVTPSYKNGTIEMPFFKIPSSKSRCCVG